MPRRARREWSIFFFLITYNVPTCHMLCCVLIFAQHRETLPDHKFIWNSNEIFHSLFAVHILERTHLMASKKKTTSQNSSSEQIQLTTSNVTGAGVCIKMGQLHRCMWDLSWDLRYLLFLSCSVHSGLFVYMLCRRRLLSVSKRSRENEGIFIIFIFSFLFFGSFTCDCDRKRVTKEKEEEEIL